MSDNVCKFCGAREHSKISRVYLCGSNSFAGEWKQSDNCQQRSAEIRAELEGAVEILKVRLESEAKLKEILRRRIEAAKQRLELLNGKHVGQAEIYAVIAILEGKE